MLAAWQMHDPAQRRWLPTERSASACQPLPGAHQMPSKGIDEQSGAKRSECPNHGVLDPL